MVDTGQIVSQIVRGAGGGPTMDGGADADLSSQSAEFITQMNHAATNGNITGSPSGPITKDTERPADDPRDAATIIAASPLLSNLGKREQDGLKKQVGDYQHDPDAAYRAVAVLNHVEEYKDNGDPVYGNTVGNGKIDGYSKAAGGSGHEGSEAERLDNFIKFGFSRLKENDDLGGSPWQTSGATSALQQVPSQYGSLEPYPMQPPGAGGGLGQIGGGGGQNTDASPTAKQLLSPYGPLEPYPVEQPGTNGGLGQTPLEPYPVKQPVNPGGSGQTTGDPAGQTTDAFPAAEQALSQFGPLEP